MMRDVTAIILHTVISVIPSVFLEKIIHKNTIDAADPSRIIHQRLFPAFPTSCFSDIFLLASMSDAVRAKRIHIDLGFFNVQKNFMLLRVPSSTWIYIIIHKLWHLVNDYEQNF